jgi:hypothetical protein
MQSARWLGPARRAIGHVKNKRAGCQRAVCHDQDPTCMCIVCCLCLLQAVGSMMPPNRCGVTIIINNLNTTNHNNNTNNLTNNVVMGAAAQVRAPGCGGGTVRGQGCVCVQTAAMSASASDGMTGHHGYCHGGRSRDDWSWLLVRLCSLQQVTFAAIRVASTGHPQPSVGPRWRAAVSMEQKLPGFWAGWWHSLIDTGRA